MWFCQYLYPALHFRTLKPLIYVSLIVHKLYICPTWMPGLSLCHGRKLRASTGQTLSPTPVTSLRNLGSSAWEESQEAWPDFWTAKGDKMHCPFNVTDFQSDIHSEKLKLPSRMALSFEISSQCWQMGLEHVLTQPCMASCKAPSMLRMLSSRSQSM